MNVGDRILFTIGYDQNNIVEGEVMRVEGEIVKLKVFNQNNQYYSKWYYVKNIKVVKVIK